jgi:hypothetical protein
VAPIANEHLISFAKDVLKRRIAADRIETEAEVGAADPENLKSAIIGYENEKPFVILGEVGHGKTTFLNYLRFVAAKDLFGKYIQIEADFLDRPDSALEVTDFIYTCVESQLLSRYSIDVSDDATVRGALHLQLERFRKSSLYKLRAVDPVTAGIQESEFIQEQLKNRHEYFKSLVRHLKHGRGKSIAFFFDNLDRRDAAIQEAAFLKASSIARDWECVVFICLRPATFYQSLKRGLLDSLAPRTFTVGAPDLGLVLKRRFHFAKRVALGEVDTPILRDAVQSRDVSFRLPNVAEIFACCEFSTKKGASAIQMLGAMSNGNIRYMLELTKRTLASGHLDTGKILNRIQTQGSYFVPDFEAVTTLLYGDYDQYDPKSSVFVNLLDIFHSDTKEHFIRILVLDYLSRFSHRDESSGAVPYADLLTYLESFYFDVATIQRHLAILTEGGCVDAGVATDHDELRSSTIRITSRGAYHLNNLVTDFMYVDAVIVDTPIIDHAARAHIFDTQKIEERLNRTKAFLEYLGDCSGSIADAEGRHICVNIVEKTKASWVAVETHVRERGF